MAQNVHGCRTNVKLLKTVGVLAKNPVNMKKVVIVHILPCKITTFFIFTGGFAGTPTVFNSSTFVLHSYTFCAIV